MRDDDPSSFDPAETYVHIAGNQAVAFAGGEAFWADLMSGQPGSAEARRVEAGGWLMTAFGFDADWPHWEMHPEGEEILVLLSGAADMVFDDGEHEWTTPLTAGRACIVPRGAWHRQIVHEPGRMLAFTCGKGTQHRPR